MKLIYETSIIKERLEEIAPNIYFSDYVGDIVNWLINKPNNYRIGVDLCHDIFSIADAYSADHREMFIQLYKNGAVRLSDDEMQEFIQMGFGRDFGFQPGDYFFGGLDLGYIGTAVFIPTNSSYEDKAVSRVYKYEVPISTGSLFFNNERSFNTKFKSLADKLKAIGELKD